MEMDIRQIQEVIPQRYPFLMIDRIVELEPGKKAVAIKNVTMNESFFRGHFPDKPVMPGVLITEAMAQTAIIMINGADKKNLLFFLGEINIKFIKPVYPGDQLLISAIPVKIIKNIAIVEVEAKVSQAKVAEGRITLAAKSMEK